MASLGTPNSQSSLDKEGQSWDFWWSSGLDSESQCWGPGIHFWSGNQIPHAATERLKICVQPNKYFFQKQIKIKHTKRKRDNVEGLTLPDFRTHHHQSSVSLAQGEMETMWTKQGAPRQILPCGCFRLMSDTRAKISWWGERQSFPTDGAGKTGCPHAQEWS